MLFSGGIVFCKAIWFFRLTVSDGSNESYVPEGSLGKKSVSVMAWCQHSLPSFMSRSNGFGRPLVDLGAHLGFS